MVRKQLRKRDPIRTLPIKTTTLTGYARCSTDRQDLAAQRQSLMELGVAEDRIYTDHGLTGPPRPRPDPRRRARRRHAGRAETRPPGQVRPGCTRHRRPASGTRREPGHRPGALRPGRSHGKDVLQYPRHLRRVRSRSHKHATGKCSISDLAELFSVSRPTVYRTLNRRLSP